METILIKAAQLILAFVILVTVHEFGHYIFARIFGMRVERFYLFFNPWFSLLKYDPRKGTLQVLAWTRKTKKQGDNGEEIVEEEPRAVKTFKVSKPRPADKDAKPTWRDTLYGLGWLPLGGYCSIAGMIDETTDSSQLATEPQPWEFRAKKAWQRLLVMIAGVLFNFILAIVIYVGVAWHWGDRVVQYADTYEGFDYIEQLQKAGFKTGDIPLAVNGLKADAKDADMLWNMVQDKAEVTVLRNHDQKVTFTIPDGTLQSLANLGKQGVLAPRFPAIIDKIVAGEPASKSDLKIGDRVMRVNEDTIPSYTEFVAALAKCKNTQATITVLREGTLTDVTCQVSDAGKIGVQMKPITEIYPVEEVKYSFFESIPKGISDGTNRLVTYVSSLKLLFTKEGAQSIGGFGAIGDLYPDQWDWYSFWQITAFLSVILAFMNILPIPALDGGHVVFTLWEIITRRKPSIKVLEYSQYIGMLFLFALLIYANGNDIYRFFFK